MEGDILNEQQLTVESIPTETAVLITQEVQKDVAGEEDEGTREFYGELMQDQRESEFLFLDWYKQQFAPQKLLYMGSGHDTIPKHVFGKVRVIHLSMEDYLTVENTDTKDKRYFPELGSGIKVIGNATEASFKDSSIDTVFLQDMSPDSMNSLGEEITRMLKDEGQVILSRMMLTSDKFEDQVSFLKESDKYKQVNIPQNLQSRGISESEFYVFGKKKVE